MSTQQMRVGGGVGSIDEGKSRMGFVTLAAKRGLSLRPGGEGRRVLPKKYTRSQLPPDSPRRNGGAVFEVLPLSNPTRLLRRGSREATRKWWCSFLAACFKFVLSRALGCFAPGRGWGQP